RPVLTIQSRIHVGVEQDSEKCFVTKRYDDKRNGNASRGDPWLHGGAGGLDRDESRQSVDEEP
ncbi:hypothetical protein BaRGS_00040471, partial [Batillaria attramentaria]